MSQEEESESVAFGDFSSDEVKNLLSDNESAVMFSDPVSGGGGGSDNNPVYSSGVNTVNNNQHNSMFPVHTIAPPPVPPTHMYTGPPEFLFSVPSADYTKNYQFGSPPTLVMGVPQPVPPFAGTPLNSVPSGRGPIRLNVFAKEFVPAFVPPHLSIISKGEGGVIMGGAYTMPPIAMPQPFMFPPPYAAPPLLYQPLPLQMMGHTSVGLRPPGGGGPQVAVVAPYRAAHEPRPLFVPPEKNYERGVVSDSSDAGVNANHGKSLSLSPPAVPITTPTAIRSSSVGDVRGVGSGVDVSTNDDPVVEEGLESNDAEMSPVDNDEASPTETLTGSQQSPSPPPTSPPPPPSSPPPPPSSPPPSPPPLPSSSSPPPPPPSSLPPPTSPPSPPPLSPSPSPQSFPSADITVVSSGDVKTHTPCTTATNDTAPATCVNTDVTCDDGTCTQDATCIQNGGGTCSSTSDANQVLQDTTTTTDQSHSQHSPQDDKPHPQTNKPHPSIEKTQPPNDKPHPPVVTKPQSDIVPPIVDNKPNEKSHPPNDKPHPPNDKQTSENKSMPTDKPHPLNDKPHPHNGKVSTGNSSNRTWAAVVGKNFQPTLSGSQASRSSRDSATAKVGGASKVVGVTDGMSKEELAKVEELKIQRLKFIGKQLEGKPLNHSPISILPRGLINNSNHCYIHAPLQALISCPELTNLLRSLHLPKMPTNDASSLATIVTENMVRFIEYFSLYPSKPILYDANGRRKKNLRDFMYEKPFRPDFIYEILPRIKSTLSVQGRQEDAEEFLGCFLNKLHEEMVAAKQAILTPPPTTSANETQEVKTGDNEREGEEEEEEWQEVGPKNKSTITRQTEYISSPISEIFGGRYHSTLHRQGMKVSATVEPFFSLLLDIKHESVKSVKDALELLATKEPVDLPEKDGIGATRRTTLIHLPHVLILQLKRFVFEGSKCHKLHKSVSYDHELEIPKELLAPPVKGKITASQRSYTLWAVVYHCGESPNGGHYITEAYHQQYGGWLRYDDNYVKPTNSEQLFRLPHRVPYLFFYRQSDPTSGASHLGSSGSSHPSTSAHHNSGSGRF